MKDIVTYYWKSLFLMSLVKKVGESSRVDSVLESVIQKGLRESSKLPKVEYFLLIAKI